MSDTDHHPQRILYSYSLTGRWTKGRHDDRGSPKALLSVVDLLDRDSYEPWFLAAGEGPLIDTMRARDVHIIHGDVASLSRRRPLWSLQRLQRQRRLLRDGRPTCRTAKSTKTEYSSVAFGKQLARFYHS